MYGMVCIAVCVGERERGREEERGRERANKWKKECQLAFLHTHRHTHSEAHTMKQLAGMLWVGEGGVRQAWLVERAEKPRCGKISARSIFAVCSL